MKRKKVIADRGSSVESIVKIAGSIQSLNRRALRAYTPVVEDLLRSRSRDVRLIEHTLDGLLDFCGYDPILQLYRELCRHYWDIDPAATASYVNFYREMWDSDEPEGNPVRTEPTGQHRTNRKRLSPAATSSTCPPRLNWQPN